LDLCRGRDVGDIALGSGISRGRWCLGVDGRWKLVLVVIGLSLDAGMHRVPRMRSRRSRRWWGLLVVFKLEVENVASMNAIIRKAIPSSGEMNCGASVSIGEGRGGGPTVGEIQFLIYYVSDQTA
jgi:hypothetical protein